MPYTCNEINDDVLILVFLPDYFLHHLCFLQVCGHFRSLNWPCLG